MLRDVVGVHSCTERTVTLRLDCGHLQTRHIGQFNRTRLLCFNCMTAVLAKGKKAA